MKPGAVQVAGSLADPIARVERAIHHYRTLKFDFHWGVDHRRRSVTATREREGLEYSFHVGEIEPLDPAWPVVIGDAYHNLRAALDNLAYQLHVRKFNGAVPDDGAEDSAFPVYLRQPRVRRDGRLIAPIEWRSIRNLDGPEIALIERLQPYQGFGTGYPPDTPDGQIRRGLWDVHRIDIIDKHRQRQVVTSVPVAMYLPRFPPQYGGRQTPRIRVPLESHAEIDRWTFDVAPPPESVEMHPFVFTTVTIDPSVEPGVCSTSSPTWGEASTRSPRPSTCSGIGSRPTRDRTCPWSRGRGTDSPSRTRSRLSPRTPAPSGR